MAGSFGYGHYDISMKIGEDRLFPAVREHAGATAAPGFSCRHQIADGTGASARHPIEILAGALRPPPSSPARPAPGANEPTGVRPPEPEGSRPRGD
jgi:hypothetical protein